MTVNSIYSYVERSPEGNRVPPMEGNRERLEQKHGLSRLLRDSSDSSADLLDQLDGQMVPCTGSLYCHWKKKIMVFASFPYLLLVFYRNLTTFVSYFVSIN